MREFGSTMSLPFMRRAFQPQLQTRAAPASVDEAAREVDVVWSTGAIGMNYIQGEGIVEERLSLEPGDVRLDRFNSVGALLNNHHTFDMRDQIGEVIAGSARIENGVGLARLRFSERSDVEEIWRDVAAGILRSTSIGYRVHTYLVEYRDMDVPLFTAIDWEPFEISIVPVGVDAGAMIRAPIRDAQSSRNSCTVIRHGAPQAGAPAITQEAIMADNTQRVRRSGVLQTASRALGLSGQEDLQNRAHPQGDDGAATRTTRHVVQASGQSGDPSNAADQSRSAPAAQAQGSDPAPAASYNGNPADGQRSAAPAAGSDPAPAREAAPAADPAPLQSEPVQSQRSAGSGGGAAVAAERGRVQEIYAMQARHSLPDELVTRLVNDGSSLDAARSAVLETLAQRSDQSSRRAEPARAASGDGGMHAAMAAALYHRCNPREDLPAESRDFRGLSVLEMARSSLEARGTNTRGMSRLEIAGLALQQRAAGAGYHTVSDFPTVLGDTVNRSLRAAYDRTPRTFTQWARQTTAPDFRPVTRAQLSGAPDLRKLNESGEFEFGTMSDGAESWQLVTYGRQIALSRQAIVNDDLDAFTRVPAAFGASAADLESDLVYSILTGNPNMGDGNPLFDSAFGNDGTAADITEDSLSEAMEDFSRQTGLEGRLISVLPEFLLVPTGKRRTQALKQVTAVTPGSSDEVNPFAGTLTVIPEPRLLPAAGGVAPWFLAAAANRVDTIEYAYLDGQQGVFTEMMEGFNVDGIQMRARLDFTAKAIDRVGLYRNAGV